MNTQILTILMQQLVAPLLAAFVLAARMKNPAASDTDVAAEAEGDVKHSLRGKLGFLVDVLWEMPQFRQPLDAEIAAAVKENPLPEALTALLVAAPPPKTVAVPQQSSENQQSSEKVITLGSALTESANGAFTQAQENLA